MVPPDLDPEPLSAATTKQPLETCISQFPPPHHYPFPGPADQPPLPAAPHRHPFAVPHQQPPFPAPHHSPFPAPAHQPPFPTPPLRHPFPVPHQQPQFLAPPVHLQDIAFETSRGYGPFFYAGAVTSANSSASGPLLSGSFNELLRVANAGLLHCKDNHTCLDIGKDSGGSTGLGKGLNNGVCSVSFPAEDQCDDGYCAGDEPDHDHSSKPNLASDIYGIQEGEPDNDHSSEPNLASDIYGIQELKQTGGHRDSLPPRYPASDYGSDHDNCFGAISDTEDDRERTPCIDTDCVDEDECNNEDGGQDLGDATEQTKCSTVLGDCGCVTDHPGDEKSDGDDESEDEEVIIDVELQQEIYIDKAQEGVPYRKRKRYRGSEKRPNCRKPRMMSAIERAMRSSSTRKTEHIFEPILGMVFDSREEAKEFYNLYSWEVGFGVKFNQSRGTKSGCRQKKDDVNKEEEYRSMQDIVCQKSGFDNRVRRSTKRCGCPAKIHLLRTDDYGWYISSIVKEHNHPLSVTCGEKREWKSHRQIDDGARDTIRYLRENNVPLTKIHCILGSMFGSNGDVPWTKRSLRTICNQITRDQMDGDIKKTMEIFKKMHDEDPGFQFSVDLDSKARIKSLMWCSGRSREQYA